MFQPFYVGPKTFSVVLDCLTKVATDILLPCGLKTLVHAFPGGKKTCSNVVQILFSLPCYVVLVSPWTVVEASD